MRKITSSLVLLAVASFVGCGGGGEAPENKPKPAGVTETPENKPKAAVVDTPEIVGKEIAGNMRAMAEILGSITDEASAKAAVPKIDAVRTKMRAVATRAKAMPKLSASEVKASDAFMMKEMAEVMPLMQAAQEKFQATMQKNPQLMQILEKALAGMENDM